MFFPQAQEAEELGDHMSRQNYSQKALNLNILAIALYIILALSVSIFTCSLEHNNIHLIIIIFESQFFILFYNIDIVACGYKKIFHITFTYQIRTRDIMQKLAKP